MDTLMQELNERLEALFQRCPELHGFAVRLDCPVPRELTCHPVHSGTQAEAALCEIAQMLSELLDERPEAAALLRPHVCPDGALIAGVACASREHEAEWIRTLKAHGSRHCRWDQRGPELAPHFCTSAR